MEKIIGNDAFYPRLMSLRNSTNNLLEKKSSYVNFGKIDNPSWSIVVNKPESDFEFVGYKNKKNVLPNLKKLCNSRFFEETTKKYNIDFGFIKQISELKVSLNLLNRLMERNYCMKKLQT